MEENNIKNNDWILRLIIYVAVFVVIMSVIFSALWYIFSAWFYVYLVDKLVPLLSSAI